MTTVCLGCLLVAYDVRWEPYLAYPLVAALASRGCCLEGSTTLLALRQALHPGSHLPFTLSPELL